MFFSALVFKGRHSLGLLECFPDDFLQADSNYVKGVNIKKLIVAFAENVPSHLG